MIENSRFVDQFNHLVDKDRKEINFTTHVQLVKIQKANGAMFMGILMNKSIAIPFTENVDTDDIIKNLVRLNNMDLDRQQNEPHAAAACRALGLNFNGANNGFYSDGSALDRSNIMILHIYPKEFISTQDQFIDKLKEMFLGKDCAMILEET